MSKSFSLDGYNVWRDMLRPKQILNRMCKQFRLQPPKYFEKKICIYDSAGNLVHEQHEHESTFHHLATNLLPEFADTGKSKTPSMVGETVNNSDESAPEDEANQFAGSSKDFDEKRLLKEEQLALDTLHSWEKFTNVSVARVA